MKKTDTTENADPPAKAPQIENAATVRAVLSADETAKQANEETAAALERYIAQRQAKGK